MVTRTDVYKCTLNCMSSITDVYLYIEYIGGKKNWREMREETRHSVYYWLKKWGA